MFKFLERPLIAVLMAVTLLLPNVASSQAGEGTDPGAAVNTPDAYAWTLFAEINQDAGFGDGRVVWETWKNAVNDTDVFLPGGDKPPAWDSARPGLRVRGDLEALPLQLQLLRRAQGLSVPAFDPNVGQGNEVRMNRAAFEFVRSHELYHLDGQVAFFSQADVDRPKGFPLAAKEIKAQWRPLDNGQDPKKYHTAVIPGSDKVWGLTAIHITTKDLPNWFWATFEHTDNPLREQTVGSVDRAGVPDSLRNTKWENYVLRGTQIDFSTPTGKKTILANSQIESGFEDTSSCLTCHARATLRDDYERLPIFEVVGGGSTGVPNEQWFKQVGQQRFFQTDFVWSLARAHRQAPRD